MVIEAHVYDTEKGVLNAIEIINVGEGIPKDNNSRTTSYTQPLQFENKWLIPADEITKKYLKNTEQVQMPEPSIK